MPEFVITIIIVSGNYFPVYILQLCAGGPVHKRPRKRR